MATSSATATPATCANCNITGLPILPVRYAVVPADLKPALPHLPAGMSGKRVKDIALDSAQYQYSLRTLRGGVLYLFYEKGPRGKNYWQVFSVTHDGHVSILNPGPEPADSIACANINHSVPRTAYFCIERPEKCGKVWIAFSQALWSGETYVQYTQDATLRAKRMQLIEPANWINSPQHEHAIEATQANIEQVLEYVPGAEQAALSPSKLNPISKRDGSYEAYQLARQSSLYPAIMRNAKVDKKGQPITTSESLQTIKLMHQSGKRPDGGSHPPMLLALWDGIGITHELNGYRNEAAGRIKQYGDERELEVTALAAIEGAKKALEDKAEARVETKEQIFKDQRTLDPNYLRRHANSLPKPQNRYRLDDIDLIEQWNAQEVPIQYSTRLNQLISLYNQTSNWQGPALPASIAKREQQRTPIINEVNAYLKNRDPNKQAAIKDAREGSWPKYEKKLNVTAYQTFKTNYEKFLTDADKLIDARTIELIKWLEAPLFIDTLEDYHNTNIKDGVAFEDVVGDAIFGMGSSRSGAKKLETWAKEAKASKPNIIWRAVALNQKEAITEIDKALAYARANQTPLTALTVNALIDNLKSLQRTADAYKKAQTVYNQNERAYAALAPNATATDIQRGKAFGHRLKPVNTRGVDKIIMTAGDALYRAMRIDKLGDLLSEKVIQHIFCIRAFVDPQTSLDLVKAQANEQKAANREARRLMQQRSNLAAQFLDRNTPAIRAQQASALGQAWSKLQSDNPGAIKDARLALVVGLIEGANFAKLWHESEGDLKTRAKIAASAISIMSAVADIASAPAKTLWGDEGVTYQKIKLIGGTLGGVASVVGAGVDLDSTVSEWRKGHWGIAGLYFLKSFAGATTGLLTFAAAFTYSAGILEKMVGRTVGKAMYKFGERAGAIIAARIMMLSVGLWLTIGLVVLEVLIWAISDNKLQDWCEQCVFGKDPTKDEKKIKPEAQMETFANAIQEVV